MNISMPVCLSSQLGWDIHLDLLMSVYNWLFNIFNSTSITSIHLLMLVLCSKCLPYPVFPFITNQTSMHSSKPSSNTNVLVKKPPTPAAPTPIFPSQQFQAEVFTPSSLLMVICHIWFSSFGSAIRLLMELCFILLCSPYTSRYSSKELWNNCSQDNGLRSVRLAPLRIFLLPLVFWNIDLHHSFPSRSQYVSPGITSAFCQEWWQGWQWHKR